MKTFQKRVEDFTCEKCGVHVEGGGYTNHCPECLWSRHVDINPGDRAAACAGLMRPCAVHKKGEQYRIEHECEHCGHKKTNDVAADDNFDVLTNIALS